MNAVVTIKSGLPADLETLADQARGYAACGMADNTRRAYAADWRDFQGWCDQVGATALPASPNTLAMYLTAKAGTVSVATLARRCAAMPLTPTQLFTRAGDLELAMAVVLAENC